MYLSEVPIQQRLPRRRFISPYLGQPPGIPGLTASEEKALRITSTFETGRPVGFGGLTGNFDGMGLSFGLLQWNIGSQSLQPLLIEFARDHPQRFDAVFGPHANLLRQVLRQSKDDQLRWAQSINDARNRIVEPWASYFHRLEDDPAFRQIQLRHVRARMNRAIHYARQLGLRSERGLALMFDNVTQSGPYWLEVKDRAALIQQRRAEFERQNGRPPPERELLAIIANVVADTSVPRWREDVRVRRMTIIEGRGRVHGHDFDLEREFGLTDQPWETAGAAIPLPAPSQPAAPPMPRPTNGTEGRLIQDALRRGVRGENALTDLVFYVRHPERQGQPLRREEQQLAREWLDIRSRSVRPALAQLVPAGPGGPTPTAAPPVPRTPIVDHPAPSAPVPNRQACVVSRDGNTVRCGTCEATERRIRAFPPTDLVPIPAELRIDRGSKIPQVDRQALAAYQRLYQAARAAGIPDPYLKIISGYRDYDEQTRLWRGKLLRVFGELGCDSASLPCLASAIDATSQALRSLPLPHPPNTWLNRFREQLVRSNCSVACDPQRAVQVARQGVAPPGSSRHHTGRAVDVFVGRRPGAVSSASTAPEDVRWQRAQPVYQWLVCNAARFGFYPYNVEPWHWEYNPPE